MRTSAEPQVRPPPSASSSTRSPRRMRPSRARLGERQRHRGRRGVGVPIDRHHHPLRRQAELAAHRVDDPQIGLVRHQPVHVGAGPARWRPAPRPPPRPVSRRRGGTPRGRSSPDGRAGRAGRPRRRRTGCRRDRPGRADGSRARPGRRCRCRSPAVQEHRAGAVAEQDAGAAVLPVRGCGNRPRCRSPARRAPGPLRIMRRPPTAHR